MTDITRAILFAVSCVFTHNFVFARMLGTGALLDDNRSIEQSAVLGLVVTVIMAATAVVNNLIYKVLLAPMHVEFLQTVVFVLVIALAVQTAEIMLAKKCPVASKHTAVLTAGCALLGASVLTTGGNLIDALVNGLLGGLGFLVAVVLMAGVHERIRFSRIPAPMKGLPIALVSASLMALAFMGFMGI